MAVKTGTLTTFAFALLLVAGGVEASRDGEAQQESRAPEAEAPKAQPADTGARLDARPCEATRERLAARLRSDAAKPGSPPAAGRRTPAEEAKLLREALERDPAIVACLFELMGRQARRPPPS